MSRTVDTKLTQRRPHLRREGKIGCAALLFTDDHPQLIDDLAFVHPLEERADEAVGNHLRRIAGEELRDPGNTMADEVVQ